MVPRCRGGEHAASRRGRIRIIALPPMEEVVVAVSMEPRRCWRARKHGRGREYQKSKFPCHDRGSSALTSEVVTDQSAACSKRRIRRTRGCALTFAQISLAFRKERYAVWPMSASGHFRPPQRVSAAVRCLLFPESELLTARQRNDANGMDRPRSRPRRLSECVGGLSGKEHRHASQVHRSRSHHHRN
jgi:hypothetical protein